MVGLTGLAAKRELLSSKNYGTGCLKEIAITGQRLSGSKRFMKDLAKRVNAVYTCCKTFM